MLTTTPRNLPEALGDPVAYPHVPDRVEVRETHISWVFLAGEKAYKVKKPVKFPFLDYSSAARRRELCHAEVELGRRFAPSVYCGVVAISPRPDGGLVIRFDRWRHREQPRAGQTFRPSRAEERAE